MNTSAQLQLPLHPKGWSQGKHQLSRSERTAATRLRRTEVAAQRIAIVALLIATPDLLRGVQTTDVMAKYQCTYDTAYRAIKQARATITPEAV